MAGQPTPFVNAFAEPAIGSLRYNTSQAGSPLPIVYGTQRVSVNLLEFWGFQGGSGKGGKGGLTGKSSGGKKAAHYSVNVALAICQGPVGFQGASHGSGGNNRVWANAGIAYGPGSVGLNSFAGNDGQAPDPVFEAQDGNVPVLGYSGTCYVTGDPLQLGQSPVLPNVSFEITGFLAGTGGINFPDDASPPQIIQDLITNARYGAGFPLANVDADTFYAYGLYCTATNLALSLLLDRLEPAARTIEYICQVTVAAPFWSGASLKIVPYAVNSYTNQGVTFTPNLTVQYAVSDRDFIDWGGGTDPVVVTRSDPSQATNWLSVEYLDSNNNYNNNIAYAFEQGAIDIYGVRTEATIEGHLMTNATTANISAQFQLQRKQLVRNTYKFQLGWTFALLDPMDIISLTDSAAGLSNVPVRILSIDENDNGELTFTAEELPGVTAGLPVYNTVTPSSNTPTLFEDPGNANAPIIFEPNPPLSAGSLEVWILSSGGATWGGANVFVSTDGDTYQFVGTLFSGARQGTLTANLPSYSSSNPDTTNTLSVDLTESQGELTSGSATDAANGITLCYCDGELLSYETATLTSTNHYNLTTLYRAFYGTSANLHTSGGTFAYLGLATNPVGVLKYIYPSTLIGVTIFIKLQSFNQFLNGTQDLADLFAYEYTLNGDGAVTPTNVPFSFNGIPQNGTPILNYTFGVGDNFPANFTGSVCTSGTAATASTAFNISKNGTNFATMTFGAASTTGVFAGSAESFSPGDILKITPARTDATLANLTGNLAGMA